MDRRAFLAAIGTSAAAGCTTSSNPSSDPEFSQVQTDTPTAAQRSFRIVSYDHPTNVEIGEEFQVVIQVENTGGQTATFSGYLFVQIDGGEWDRTTEWVFEDIPPGETAQSRFQEPYRHYALAEIRFRLGEQTASDPISIVPARREFGRYFTAWNETQTTVYKIEFRESPANPGDKWALAYVDSENLSERIRRLPAPQNFHMVVGGERQYDSELDYGETDEWYPGGEVQAGIRREGYVVFRVPEDTEKSEIEVVWARVFDDGDVAVYWSEGGGKQ